MRLSPQRHTLAVLRVQLRLTQKEMATLMGCSTATVQAIELGKLKLSEKLGLEIAVKTGVRLEWLMAGDVSKPILDTDGAPYTLATFENLAAKQHTWIGQGQNYLTGALGFSAVLMQVGRALLAAAEKDASELLAYRLLNAVRPICDQFPGYEDLLAQWLKQKEQKYDAELRRTEAEREKYEPPMQEAVANIESALAAIKAKKMSQKEFDKYTKAQMVHVKAEEKARKNRLDAFLKPEEELVTEVVTKFITELQSQMMQRQEKIRAKQESERIAKWEAKRKKNPNLPLIPPTTYLE